MEVSPSMLVNMSVVASTCGVSSGTLLQHPGMDNNAGGAESPIGFEATMSVAMELETKLKAEVTSDAPATTDGDDRPVHVVNQHHDNSKHEGQMVVEKEGKAAEDDDADICCSPPPASVHRVGSSPPHAHDSVDGDLMEEEEDDDCGGQSSESESSCYGEMDTSRDDDMDDNDKFQNGLLHLADGKSNDGGNTRRPGSVEDSSYYATAPPPPHYRRQHVTQGDEVIQSRAYQCHLCPYTSATKSHFNSHVNSHYDHKCSLCDYRSRTEGRLKRHLKDFHSDLVPDVVPAEKGGKMKGDGDGSQNKRKTYRCKQCNYVAIIKAEFWAHSKTHIKMEKLLTCPRCPFVTEYKHHLEYHLRNHFGSKPFKCPKCSYSCVNKSMLNSHMKSHSNIYQYRCADCTYATKYCHSLKLHLRKYTHAPATVLNMDGTPNPLPIIDVYGTRRGPRTKKTHSDANNDETRPLSFSPLQMTTSNGDISPAVQPPPPPPPTYFFSAAPGSHPNGFYADGILQQQSATNMPKPPQPLPPPPPVNNGIKEESHDGGCQQQPHSNNNVSSFKCNLCEFCTDHTDIFSKHMLLHAATENQDLCNLYGITSDTLLQESNHQHHQQHPQMHVATTMAAVAAAFGLGGHNSPQMHQQRGAFHRPVPTQLSPKQLHLSAPHQDKKPNCEVLVSHGTTKSCATRPQSDDGVRGGGATTNLPVVSHPLEHLRVFSEQASIQQPFVSRHYQHQSDAYPKQNCTNGGTNDPESLVVESTMKLQHGSTPSAVSPLSQQPPSQLTSSAVVRKHSTSPLALSTAGGLGPLDLSSATKPLLHPHAGQYMNQLHHHHQSPFQHFALQHTLQQQQQMSVPTSLPPQHDLSPQGTTTHGFSEMSPEENSQHSPSEQGQTGLTQESLHQQRNRRKGKAFKLDRICMKLQKKDKSCSPPSSDHQQPPVDLVSDESGDEACVPRRSSSRNGQHNNCDRTVNDEPLPTNNNSVEVETPMKVTQKIAKKSIAPSVPNECEYATDDSSKDVDDGDGNWKEAYECQYCDMAFKDCIMYTVHMGYHGFKDPFKCNMCGQQTKDKVSFFLHIARTAHL